MQDIHHRVRPEEVELVRRDYAASGGWETFLAYEDVKQVGGCAALDFTKSADWRRLALIQPMRGCHCWSFLGPKFALR